MSDAAGVDAAAGLDAPPTRIRYRVLAFACGLSMITYLDRVCFGAAAPDLARELSLSGVSDLKWAFTAFAISYGAFEIPTGWLGDRWGPRGVLIRIVAWWSVCTALTAVVGLRVGTLTLGGLGTLIVLRFLFGAGEAGAYPNITRTLHNWFPVAQWEMAQGAVWMTGRLMGGLTPLLWALLVKETAFTSPLFDWRGAFALFGVLGLAWCAAFALWFRNRPSEHPGVNAAERSLIGSHNRAAASHGGIPWGALLGNVSMWALCLMYFLITYVWIFNITYLPSYLNQRFHMGEGNLLAAVYKGAPLWVGAAGCILGGFAVDALTRMGGDRRRARRQLGMTAMLCCAGFWFAALYAPNVHVFCVLISLSAFSIDLTMGSAWATCQDVGRSHAAIAAACMNTVGTFGAAVAGWLTGTLIERSLTGRAAAMGISADALPDSAKQAATLAGYDSVFVTNVAAFVIAAVCWRLITPEVPIDDEDRLVAG